MLVEVQTLNDEMVNIEEKTALSPEETQSILASTEDFESLWNSASVCQETRKKIIRLLIKDIIVHENKETHRLTFTLHWEGGSHTEFDMAKPLSGAKQRKTSEEDFSIIHKMAPRYRDEEIARVLSKLGRKTGAGLRWNSTRVQSARSRYKTPRLTAAEDDILTLVQARRYTGVSDKSLMKLIERKIIHADQIVPYAPFEIKKSTLDAEPAKPIITHLKKTGKLVFDRVTLERQPTLF